MWSFLPHCQASAGQTAQAIVMFGEAKFTPICQIHHWMWKFFPGLPSSHSFHVLSVKIASRADKGTMV